jgi:hypothetical protein
LPDPQVHSTMSRREPERETRIPGLARTSACPSARDLPEGTAGHRWQSGLFGVRKLRRARRRVDLIQSLVCCRGHDPGGSTDAGGEDVGYFATLVKRVRLPPLMSRTVEVPRQGSPRATAQVFPKGAPVLTQLTPISPFPCVLFKMPRRCEAPRPAVVKMSVTSPVTRPPERAATASPVPRQTIDWLEGCKNLAVVPAKAGTHTAEYLRGAPMFDVHHNNKGRRLWVPPSQGRRVAIPFCQPHHGPW